MHGYLLAWLCSLSANISSASAKPYNSVCRFLDAGGENAESRGNGEVCNDTCFDVLRHVGALGSKGDLIIPMMTAA